MKGRLSRRKFVGVAGATALTGCLHRGPVPDDTGVDDRVVWRFETDGKVRSSPSIVDDTVYFGSFDGYVYAVDAESGDEEWRYGTDSSVYASPNVHDGRVYVQSDGLYALDAETGTEIWRQPFTGGRSSPTVYGDLVYVGGEDGTVRAFEVEGGDFVWRFETEGEVGSSPCVAHGTVYVGSYDGSIYALDAGDGEMNWEFESDKQVTDSVAVGGEQVFVRSEDGHHYALSRSTGSENWSVEVGGPYRPGSAPTVDEGLVYFGNDLGVLVQNVQDGEILRMITSPRDEGSGGAEAPAPYPVRSSPTVSQGTVYFGHQGGGVRAVNTETEHVRWNVQTGHSIRSSPTISEGVLYVGSDDGHLYAIDTEHDGSSEDSRVRHRTLGHHDNFDQG